MRSFFLIIIVCYGVLNLCLFSTAYAKKENLKSKTVEKIAFVVPSNVEAILDNRCYFCHDEDEQKGDIQLDNITDMNLTKRLDLFNRIQEQVYFKHMPPKKKSQPSEKERGVLLKFLSGQLAKHNASTLEGKLKKPDFGNYVNHEKLFSGEYKNKPGFSYDRRWLISEYIFNAKFQRILNLKTIGRKGKKRFEMLGSSKIRGLSIANPFLLPTNSGVRYYANEDFTGGHLSSMLTNAQNISKYITDLLANRRRSKYLTAITAIMLLENKQNATLKLRREFLEKFIAIYSADIYGKKNQALLPVFKPVVLKEVQKLKEGEKYKKAPTHVAFNMLKKLGGDKVIHQLLLDSEQKKKSDDTLREMCERIWFYNGDFERDIQGRMTVLRDYMPELRKEVEKNKGRRIKRVQYKPLVKEEMKVLKAAILKHRKKGDRFNAVIDKCESGWKKGFKQDLIQAGSPSDDLLLNLIEQLFQTILERSPGASERQEYLVLSRSYIRKLGKLKAIQKLIQTFILSSEFAYRQEFGKGAADKYGRKILSPRDASYAIAYALTDQSPDSKLVEAARGGRLNTRADYKREVVRLLKKRNVSYIIDNNLEGKNYQDNSTKLPIRKLRFFREFFGYPSAIKIFKDEKRFGGDRMTNAMSRLLNEADRLVEYILEKDQNVFEELLTTEKFFVYHDGDNERMKAASNRIKSIYEYFKDEDWKKFKKSDLRKHKKFLKKVKMRSINPDKLNARNRQGNTLQLFKKSMTTITARLDKGQKDAAPFDMYRGYGSDFMPGENVAKFFNFRKDNWDWSAVQPAKIPNRKGILTHPIWLIANAQNAETDPIHRGKWIREKLLAGTIPNIPITVDAVVPEDHHKTLRNRLAGVTEKRYCWKCHEGMNPLGYVFESYDDFGRFRTEESLEYPEHLLKKKPNKAKGRNHLLDLRDIYKTSPVDSSGVLAGTGDKTLDGDVKDALDLVERLGKSSKVRQSIIRHAFRYFMGRNEVLSDSKTLMDADRAYVKSGGSFDAVIVSLLTSDSFIYRKPIED